MLRELIFWDFVYGVVGFGMEDGGALFGFDGGEVEVVDVAFYDFIEGEEDGEAII